MRVLLLNPPAADLVLRDYYCSKTTKANYLNQPIDLLHMSGRLAARWDTLVLDAVAEQLDERNTLARIRSLDPDVVVALVASVTWTSDRAFLARVAGATGARILATGDILRGAAGARLAADQDWLESVVADFSRDDVVRLIEGRSPRAPGRGIHMPTPRHDLFPRRGYRFPFSRGRSFTTLLTDHGCPYPCRFCVMGTLPYGCRPLGEVEEELDAIQSMGLAELFVLDQTFGLDAHRGRELAGLLGSRDFGWTAFTRPDTALTEGLLGAMAAGGCHTVILGIESASDAWLETQQKGYTTEQTEQSVAAARAAGLRTVGTFLLGLPGDSRADAEACVDFAIRLGLDFFSANVAVPRAGTPFERQARSEGLLDVSAPVIADQAAQHGALMATGSLTADEVRNAKRAAVRRFYGRPAWLARRLVGAGSVRAAWAEAREGAALLWRNTA